MLEKLRTLFASSPKTLPQATETITEARATLNSVGALFDNAGLNLEQLLTAGPDALKAHLESIDNTEELAEALQENEALSKNLEDANGHIGTLTANATAFLSVFSAVGFEGADIKADEFKTKFDAHVSKQTTLALAKTGHPPAHVPAADVTPGAKPTGAELHATWKAMKPSPERLAFFGQHEAEITAHERSS